MPDAKVFFTCSGTEANEAALLLATTYRRSNQVLALRNSYHGRAFATVGITGNRSWSASSLSPLQTTYLQGGYRFRSSFAGLPDDAYVEACVRDLRELLDVATAGRRRLPDRGAGAGRRRVRGAAGRPARGVRGGAAAAGRADRQRRGADRLGPDRRALLGHPGLRRGAGRDDVRQGAGRRLRHRRRHRPGRRHGLPRRQLDLDLRRQPGLHRGGLRGPRVRPRPRPAGQRGQARRAAEERAAGRRRALPGGRRGARQGPDDRRRAGRAGRVRARARRRGPRRWSGPGPPACSSARAGCTATCCGSPRRSRSPRPRRRRGWASSPRVLEELDRDLRG